MRVIDAHVHLLPDSARFTRWAADNGATNTLAGLEGEMAAHGVARAVLVSHFDASDGRRAAPMANRPNNDLLALLESTDPARFRGLLTVNVAADGVPDLDRLDEALRQPAVAGVKFFLAYEPYYADDARLRPVFEVVERHRAVAMFHTGDTLVKTVPVKYAHPMPVDEVAVAHPRMKVVLAHAGQHWMEDAGELVGKDPNVWADLSGWFVGRSLPPFADLVKEQFRSLVFWADGCDKLMFGSDWPLMRIGPYLDFIDGCDFLSAQEKRQVLHDNAARLYWGEG